MRGKMTDLVKLFAEMDSMGVEELMRQSWQRSFGIMRILRGDGRFCDVTLRCEVTSGPGGGGIGSADAPGLGLVAHKVVLVSWSGYFRNLMDVGLFEEVEVMVPGVSHSALAWLLDLMYGETKPAVNDDNVDTIFQAAMILQVPLAVSLCAQLMKQRRRGSHALIGDIVSSTMPESDAVSASVQPPPTPPPSASRPTSTLPPAPPLPHNVGSPALRGLPQPSPANRIKPIPSIGMPVLHRPVARELTLHSRGNQSSTATISDVPLDLQSSPRLRDAFREPSNDYGQLRRGSEGDEFEETNLSVSRRHTTGSPFGSLQGTTQNGANSPKRQIITATRTPIFKPKMKNGHRPAGSKNPSQDHNRQSPPTSTVDATSSPPEESDTPSLPSPTLRVPQSQSPATSTVYVPMPSLTPNSVADAGINLHPSLIGTSGLSMTGMAALGALHLAPILVPTSTAPSPPPSSSPEEDEGRLVINEEDELDYKGDKKFKPEGHRTKRAKLSSGMELMQLGGAEDQMVEGGIVSISPRNNLAIVAICNICQKGFTSKTGYKKHIRTHMGAFPYHCPVCSKGYFDHYTLQEHLNAHKGLKVHGCTKCGKKYQRKKNLVIHQRTCTGYGASSEGDLPSSGSPPDSESRLLSDGPWSENGESFADEDDEASGSSGAASIERGVDVATLHHRHPLSGGSGLAYGGPGLLMTGPAIVKSEDGGVGMMMTDGGKGLLLVNPEHRETFLAAHNNNPLTGHKGGYAKIFSDYEIKKEPKRVGDVVPVKRRLSSSEDAKPMESGMAMAVGKGEPSSSANGRSALKQEAAAHPLAATPPVDGATPGRLAEEVPSSAIVKEKFQCPHCPDILSGRKSLQDHMAKVHAQPDRFTCPTCGRVFKYMTSLAHHIETVCGGDGPDRSTPVTEAPASVPPATPMTPPRSKSPVSSPLTPSRKSKRISKRNSGGGPGALGLDQADQAEECQGSGNGVLADAEIRKPPGKMLQMEGGENGEGEGGEGYVILNEDES